MILLSRHSLQIVAFYSTDTLLEAGAQLSVVHAFMDAGGELDTHASVKGVGGVGGEER